MEKSKLAPQVKSKSAKRVKNPVPNWQGCVDDSLSRSVKSSTLDSKSLQNIADNLPDEAKVVSLSDLSTLYSPYLPLRVQIVTGFCAENDKDPTLDIDDIYNIHLLKHTDLVTIRDISGEHYNIPLYSSLQFGLVYEPRNETKKFKSVNEIISSKPLPKVVVATERYNGHNEKTSVWPNDLLVIQSVHNYPGGRKRSSLKAYSITFSIKKDLPGDCAVCFSTDPWLTKLYLSDLMKFAHDLLPCNARLYFDESIVSLPKHLSHEIVTIEERRTTSSFLVSLEKEKHKRGRQIEMKELIDIPTCLGIDVYILNPLKAKDRYQNLYEDTTRLLKEFNPTEVQACVDAPSDDVYVTQAQLLAQCRQGYENVGLNIETPAIIGEYQALLPSTVDTAPQYEDLDFTQQLVDKGSPHATVNVRPPLPAKPLPSHPKIVNMPVSPPKGSLQTFRKSPHVDVSKSKAASSTVTIDTGQQPPLPPRQTSSQSQRVKRDVEMLQKPMSNTLSDQANTSSVPSSGVDSNVRTALLSLETTVDQLSRRIHRVEKQLSLMAADIKKLKIANDMDHDDVQDSKSVKHMTRDGVLRLLDDLNMPQYKDNFRQEMIDGEILSEIDETVLQQELGMNSKLHRLRLIKYIESISQALP